MFDLRDIRQVHIKQQLNIYSIFICIQYLLEMPLKNFGQKFSKIAEREKKKKS